MKGTRMSDYKERVLEDDNPVYAGYWYLADGEPMQSPLTGTVADLRAANPDIRHFQYCDMHKHGVKPIGW